ncbi:protein of unknown function DUF34 [Methanospirillum hungatei JF-1]|uniref:Uncharacterized protein n=1 Tax=Methanospirillum hungatei JF-1 (strain ATCC 27890 / DSM 864 / NBRC 100397 / JF-1) TaxID=323259 RepID=Q2FPY1_METHJ|nr:Nif3-like dinuclear metal center hexameric protein [Methanospirillum hungatei]ABD40000.1 protein of unknown function DUF34 [Methanospirillum hungatei JF-1]
MKAVELFSRFEQDIPPSYAVPGDQNGYIGTLDPHIFDVQKILVLMDYILPESPNIDYSLYDLLVLHHPPPISPVIPTYVIHSNWDIVTGGACDALADALNITSFDVLDESTGIGRIGGIDRETEDIITQGRFIHEIMATLRVHDIRTVNCNRFQPVGTICVISGFGLTPPLISKAISKGVDIVVSGDLTHPGAVLAKNANITLIDATHHATELPGLYRLGEMISSYGLDVQVRNFGIPWTRSVNRGVRREYDNH